MMNTTIKRIIKILVWPVGIALVIGVYFSDNIRGYYRFKEICAKDAGLRVYEPLQKGEGWLASGEIDAGYLLHYYDEISFVRHLDDKKSLQDLVRTTVKKDFSDDGFLSQPVDSSRQPRYVYYEEFNKLDDEVRMNSRISRVTNIQSGKPAVTYQDFTYRLFNPDWGSSGGSACSSFNRDASDKGPNDSREIAIRSAFTK